MVGLHCQLFAQGITVAAILCKYSRQLRARCLHVHSGGSLQALQFSRAEAERMWMAAGIGVESGRVRARRGGRTLKRAIQHWPRVLEAGAASAGAACVPVISALEAPGYMSGACSSFVLSHCKNTEVTLMRPIHGNL